MIGDAQDFDIVGVISRSPWFEGLPAKAHETLADAARIRPYRKNSYLFTIGERTSDIFCLLSGRVRILITSEIGQEFALTDLDPEAWLNEAALAGDLTRMLDAQVIENATVLVLPCAALLDIGERHPQMYKKLFIENVMRSRGFYRILSGMAFYPLRSRLAGRILSLIDEHGLRTDAGVHLDIGLSQNDFAQLSLGSRQRINRILGEWRDQGIMALEGNRYLIRDLEALQREAALRDDDA